MFVLRLLATISKTGGDPGGIRTHDPQIRNLMLYPAELRDHERFDSKCGQGAEASMRGVLRLLFSQRASG